MRTGSASRSVSIPEQSSKKSLPDLLISACSAVLFEPTLPDEQTKQRARNARLDSKRMDPLGWAGSLFPTSAAALERAFLAVFVPRCFLDTRPARDKIRFLSS